VITQGLFPGGWPILRKDQFIGICHDCLTITIDRYNKWNTLVDMVLYASRSMSGETFTWLSPCKVYPTCTGFRAYIPGTLLLPPSADSKRIETTGIFQKILFGGEASNMWVAMISKISMDILRGKKELMQGEKNG